ncbi:PREDICTED: uncharacterized protein LOC108765061 isoform X2 [Trachymyrmex cornetzi]|uniref:uncharacterized protein LOC108765061 isoform X2 n=1 Tax=Trachymyrmex cornetzi TaxID=471704 RepID=UPI00084F402C|nr:PREDICTED: uncharacterized protein LOC108765061 isoform X2 [Trachymyrmex cornetzi]
MNQERNANYEDRIEFIIALMTKDYKKARDIGNRLLKQNRNDVDVICGLNILKHKKNEECERSSLIESADNERERSDSVDGDATDFIDDNVDICIDPEMADKIMSHDTSLLNNKARISLSQQRMYKVIPIKVNKKVTEV